jgi:nitroreductase
MIKKLIDTSTPIHPLMADRYSGVSFDSQKPLSLETLRALAEAARWAPSCFGDEPWRFLICSKHHDEAAWQKAFDSLLPGNQGWCQYAPVLVLICTDTLFKHNGTPNNFGPYDTGAAAVSFCLQATALGLMTHQMAGYSPEKARELFAIPERFKTLAMMAVGYQLPESQLPEQFRERELKVRKRHPLASQFFFNGWDQGLQ